MGPTDHDHDRKNDRKNDRKDDRDGAHGGGHDDGAAGRQQPAEQASDIERARATSFGDVLDRVLADDDPPPAMTADERALIDVAQMVRAGSGDVEIGAARARALVDDALRAAGPAGRHEGNEAEPSSPRERTRGKRAGSAGDSAGSRRESQPGHAIAAGRPGARASGRAGGETSAGADTNDVARTKDAAAKAPRRLVRALPWAVAGLAAAAAVALALTRPNPTRPARRPELAARYRSRPADRLIGVIPKARAGLASERLDTIFADRMAGYRALSLGRLARGER